MEEQEEGEIMLNIIICVCNSNHAYHELGHMQMKLDAFVHRLNSQPDDHHLAIRADLLKF